MTTKFSDMLLFLLDPHPLDHIAAACPLCFVRPPAYMRREAACAGARCCPQSRHCDTASAALTDTRAILAALTDTRAIRTALTDARAIRAALTDTLILPAKTPIVMNYWEWFCRLHDQNVFLLLLVFLLGLLSCDRCRASAPRLSGRAACAGRRWGRARRPQVPWH